jgi:regulator of cell morphogenesis and NO signaling
MTDPVLTAHFAQQTLGDLVHQDARAAHVFERFGLDFCCGGRRTLTEAAEAHGVRLEAVVEELQALGDPTPESLEPAEWKDLDVLVQHILDRHHTYIRETAPAIQAWLVRLVERHGARHAELAAMQQVFRQLAEELDTHMVKEEHILFPYIKDLAVTRRRGGALPMGPFGTVLNPVRVMEADHALVGELVGRLRDLSGRYVPPEDACTTYKLCFAELARFELDIHRHIHLENNVLFPRALELERGLA